jgi:cytochrome-b5 reductase
MATPKPQNLLSTPMHGLYIPAGLLLFGTAIVDKSLLPYALLLALGLCGLKVYRGRKHLTLLLLHSY